MISWVDSPWLVLNEEAPYTPGAKNSPHGAWEVSREVWVSFLAVAVHAVDFLPPQVGSVAPALYPVDSVLLMYMNSISRSSQNFNVV